MFPHAQRQTWEGMGYFSTQAVILEFNLCYRKIPGLGSTIIIASSQAGIPNRTTYHEKPYSGNSYFVRPLFKSKATNHENTQRPLALSRLERTNHCPHSSHVESETISVPHTNSSFSDRASLMSLESRRNLRSWQMSY